MVEIFVYFVLKSIIRKFPCTIMSDLHHYAELYKYLNYEILKWVVHTKICTNENYLLYGSSYIIIIMTGLTSREAAKNGKTIEDSSTMLVNSKNKLML